jgi:hypothetical protein
MPDLNEDDERKIALARKLMDRYHVVYSVLAQGENSPYMTEEFRKQVAEAKKRLAPYTIAGRAAKADAENE